VSQSALAATPSARPQRRSSSVGDLIFASVAKAAGILVLVILSAIIVSLFIGGLPAFEHFGAQFDFHCSSVAGVRHKIPDGGLPLLESRKIFEIQRR